MRVTINGEERDLPDAMTIQALLESVGAPHAGVAVAKNDRVVRRADFGTDAIANGDRIEIIRAVAGG